LGGDEVASGDYFKLRERGTSVSTEIRAGFTTFLVMAYIIFVNPQILSFAGVAGMEGRGLPLDATITMTCLTAGVMSILMGLVANYPIALAPGMGLNAFVAFELVQRHGLTWPEAMGVVILEGVVIAALVLTRFRVWLMEAIPPALRRAIGVGIGLFIAFIGFANGGFITMSPGNVPPVTLGTLNTIPALVFGLGLILTAWLMTRKIRGALLWGILLTTGIAILLNVVSGGSTFGDSARLPAVSAGRPNFETFGRFDFGFFASLGAGTALLLAFSLMLTDFFDTVGTVVGVAGAGRLLDRQGRVPGIRRVLFVDAVGAVAGGVANSSTNTSFIESAAGVTDGGRTGLTSVVVGMLFLLAMLLTPLVGILPPQATAPALIVVGFYMMSMSKDIPWDDPEEAIPAFVTMLGIPFAASITSGIGAGFIAYVAIKVLRGRARDVPWMLYVIAAAFLLYFAT
jgi:AGZA family xanthine/uracil permease-like MFS transporter